MIKLCKLRKGGSACASTDPLRRWNQNLSVTVIAIVIVTVLVKAVVTVIVLVSDTAKMSWPLINFAALATRRTRWLHEGWWHPEGNRAAAMP